MQSDLAEQFGVHNASIQNWERNIYKPGEDIMARIVEWLGYDPFDDESNGLTPQ